MNTIFIKRFCGKY